MPLMLLDSPMWKEPSVQSCRSNARYLVATCHRPAESWDVSMHGLTNLGSSFRAKQSILTVARDHIGQLSFGQQLWDRHIAVALCGYPQSCLPHRPAALRSVCIPVDTFTLRSSLAHRTSWSIKALHHYSVPKISTPSKHQPSCVSPSSMTMPNARILPSG